ALRLEHRHTKNEILAMYLNLAPYGNRITGAARASRAYFACTPENLTAAQSAFLASLPQRPSAFNPLKDPEKARARQQLVLAKMNLPRVEYEHARAERLLFAKSAQPALAMHFIEHVPVERRPPPAAESEARKSAAEAAAAPLSIVRTTLDANLQ